VQLLDRIHRYIREYDVQGRELPNAASDVLDGAVDREEIDDLVKRRLLEIVRYEKDEGYCGRLCGDSFTVCLTKRAIAAFWPGREVERARPQRRCRGKVYIRNPQQGIAL
jgi:hypothetical protein